MLSVQEFEYVKSIINTYQKQGYKYYVVVTNSNADINTDIYVYLSKDEIKALDDITFTINNGIRINIDNTYRYNEQNNVLGLTTTIPGDLFIVDKYEYIYSNCSYEYKTTESVRYPDILLSGDNSTLENYCMTLSLFMVVSIFLYLFFKSILRVRR